MTPIVQIDDLVVEYVSKERGEGVKRAVNGLSLSIGEGEVFGFLGPNGAGKTTTMKVLLGFMPPTSGSASLSGNRSRGNGSATCPS